MQAGNSYDVAVIGCGPAGAVVSRELSRFGYRVLVVAEERTFGAIEGLSERAWNGLKHAGCGRALSVIGPAFSRGEISDRRPGPGGEAQEVVLDLRAGQHESRPALYTAAIRPGDDVAHNYRIGLDAESVGPVRQLCQVLDYRYARYVSTPAYIVDPFIHRGILSDTQLWVSPVYDRSESGDEHRIHPVRATVVIRTFPLLSWLWVGLFVLLTAALVLTVRAWSGSMP